MSDTAVHVIVSGRVQGVGYRAWTADAARARGLSGWVRNLRSGEVEAVFSGPAAAVDAMFDDCRRGPAAAQVAAVRIVGRPQATSGPFEVRPTV
jgi:acylphosphatase